MHVLEAEPQLLGHKSDDVPAAHRSVRANQTIGPTAAPSNHHVLSAEQRAPSSAPILPTEVLAQDRIRQVPVGSL